jgi:hypothetical protein
LIGGAGAYISTFNACFYAKPARTGRSLYRLHRSTFGLLPLPVALGYILYVPKCFSLFERSTTPVTKVDKRVEHFEESVCLISA